MPFPRFATRSLVSAPYALLALRLIVGVGFFAHGLAKWNRGPEKFGVLLAHVGVPLPSVTAWVGTLTELGGGAALIAGVGTPLVCVPLIVMMLVAMFTIHVHFGFSAVNTVGLTAAGPQFGPPGYEINLLYIAALVALALSEPTAFSVDRFLGEESDPSRRSG